MGKEITEKLVVLNVYRVPKNMFRNSGLTEQYHVACQEDAHHTHTGKNIQIMPKMKALKNVPQKINAYRFH